MVWINRGSADALQPQTKFTVYSATRTAAKAVKKGTIEITRIDGEHSAQARILEDKIADPIMVGDKLKQQTGHQKSTEIEHFGNGGRPATLARPPWPRRAQNRPKPRARAKITNPYFGFAKPGTRFGFLLTVFIAGIRMDLCGSWANVARTGSRGRAVRPPAGFCNNVQRETAFHPPVLPEPPGSERREEAICFLNLAGEGSPVPKLFRTPNTKPQTAAVMAARSYAAAGVLRRTNSWPVKVKVCKSC